MTLVAATRFSVPLCTYDLRQQRMAQSLIQGQPVHDPSGDSEVATQSDQEPLGAFWQLSEEDKKLKIQKGKRILREQFEARLRAECGTHPIGPEPRGDNSSSSAFQWLPDPSSSMLHEAGAPMGTPFVGTAEEIEDDVSESEWNWRNMPVRGYRRTPSAQRAILKQEYLKMHSR